MKNRKKQTINLFYLITIFLFLFNFSSCTRRNFDLSSKVKIVCTIFPQYDWVQQILGNYVDNTTLSLMVKSGNDFHHFQPTPSDLSQIQNCDLLIYIGGPSENWVYQALQNSANPKQKTINLLELINQNSKNECSDEHIWLSINNAITAVQEITKELCILDATNAQAFINQSEAYIKRLESMNNQYIQELSNSQKKILLCDCQPFYYLTKDYGLEIQSLFQNCPSSSDQIASESAIQQMATSFEEFSPAAIYKLEANSDKFAKSVLQQTTKKHSTEILSLDSMEATTLIQAFNGKEYLQTMDKNLQAIKKGL